MKRKPCLIENCDTCGLRAKVVLCDIAGSDLAEFQKIKRTLDYAPHQAVFYEGHVCLGLYLLCAGKVKLTRSSARGRRQIVRILGPGELIEKHVFGDRALHEVTCETRERPRCSGFRTQNFKLRVAPGSHVVPVALHVSRITFDGLRFSAGQFWRGGLDSAR